MRVVSSNYTYITVIVPSVDSLAKESRKARADIHRMTWRQVGAAGVDYVRNKTGVEVDLGLHSELETALGVVSRDHVTIINTEYGKPFTIDGFSQFMRDAIKTRWPAARLQTAWVEGDAGSPDG